MSKNNQPLSPHLTVYKWQVTNTLSIIHRFSGFILCLGGVLLSIWLISIALGDSTYSLLIEFSNLMIIKLLFVGLSFAFFYHSLNGIRHLMWDIGKGFETNELKISGAIVVIGATLFACLFWLKILGLL
jgi:succinate dehydrogenase / fumarate reductase cytochrome b subunit